MSGDFKPLLSLADVIEFIEIPFLNRTSSGHHSFKYVFPFLLRPNCIYEPIHTLKGSAQRIFVNLYETKKSSK